MIFGKNIQFTPAAAAVPSKAFTYRFFLSVCLLGLVLASQVLMNYSQYEKAVPYLIQLETTEWCKCHRIDTGFLFAVCTPYKRRKKNV